MLLCDASFKPHGNYVESWARLELLAFGSHLTPDLFCFVLQDRVVLAFKGPGEIKEVSLEGNHVVQSPCPKPLLPLGCIFSLAPPPMSLASLALASTGGSILDSDDISSSIKDSDASCYSSVLWRCIIWSGQ